MYAGTTKKAGGKDTHWSSIIGLERNDVPDRVYDIHSTRSEWVREQEKIIIL